MTYPAAHSMDTEWFAVDADGVVAIFESGEGGAVPNDAAFGASPGDPSFDTFPLDAVRVARVAARGPIAVSANAPPRAVRAVVVLGLADGSSESATGYRIPPAVLATIEAALAKHQPWVVREEDPRVLATTGELAPQDVVALAKMRGVRTVVTEDDFFEVLDAASELAGTDGLVRYANDDYGVSGRYVRVAEPDEPVKLDDLPKKAREAVENVRFPIRFADHQDLQLADYFDEQDCTSWDIETSMRGEPMPETPDFVHVEDKPRAPSAAEPTRPFPWLLIFFGVAIAGAIMWLAGRCA